MMRCNSGWAGFGSADDLRVSVSPDAGGGIRLVVAGVVDLRTAPRFRAALAAAIRDGTGLVVVDVARLTFGGAECVSALLGARTALEERGRRLLVVNAPPFFVRVLASCRLADLAG